MGNSESLGLEGVGEPFTQAQFVLPNTIRKSRCEPMHASVHARAHTHMHTYTHAHTHMHTYTHMHTHKYTHIHTPASYTKPTHSAGTYTSALGRRSLAICSIQKIPRAHVHSLIRALPNNDRKQIFTQKKSQLSHTKR